jgi:hypothetical protein
VCKVQGAEDKREEGNDAFQQDKVYKDLDPGTTYTFEVLALNEVGDGEGATLDITTRPERPSKADLELVVDCDEPAAGYASATLKYNPQNQKLKLKVQYMSDALHKIHPGESKPYSKFEGDQTLSWKVWACAEDNVFEKGTENESNESEPYTFEEKIQVRDCLFVSFVFV